MRQTESKARFCLWKRGLPMAHDTTPAHARAWHDSAHASLCLLVSLLNIVVHVSISPAQENRGSVQTPKIVKVVYKSRFQPSRYSYIKR
jgi:hypothetical protein